MVVIAGGGSGVPVYRRLQRENRPFVTGVLSKNDVDYEAACHLATGIIAEEAFVPVREETGRKAWEAICACRKVLCPLGTFGEYNRINQILRDRAAQNGWLTEEI